MKRLTLTLPDCAGVALVAAPLAAVTVVAPPAAVPLVVAAGFVAGFVAVLALVVAGFGLCVESTAAALGRGATEARDGDADDADDDGAALLPAAEGVELLPALPPLAPVAGEMRDESAPGAAVLAAGAVTPLSAVAGATDGAGAAAESALAELSAGLVEQAATTNEARAKAAM
jgi:hypothetical protein